MTYQDVINYYTQHPPVEVSNMTAYLDLLNIVVQTTVHELSENDPITEEKTFTTPQSTDKYVLVNIYETISENFMEFIILYPTDNPPAIINEISLKYRLSKRLASSSTKSFSLLDIVGYTSVIYTLQEWFTKQTDKIIYNGNSIKLQPDTEYYALYHRYRDVSELPTNMLDAFRQLLDINLKITFFSSDVESGESQIRSVSISGLSVSFNVPSADMKQTSVQRLQQQKQLLLSQLAIDYGDGEIGLI